MRHSSMYIYIVGDNANFRTYFTYKRYKRILQYTSTWHWSMYIYNIGWNSNFLEVQNNKMWFIYACVKRPGVIICWSYYLYICTITCAFFNMCVKKAVQSEAPIREILRYIRHCSRHSRGFVWGLHGPTARGDNFYISDCYHVDLLVTQFVKTQHKHNLLRIWLTRTGHNSLMPKHKYDKNLIR